MEKAQLYFLLLAVIKSKIKEEDVKMDFAETYRKLLKQRIETHNEELTFDEPFIKVLFILSQIT